MLNRQYRTIGSIFSNSLSIWPAQTVAQQAIKMSGKACLNILWRRMYGVKLFFVYFLSAFVWIRT